METVEKQKTFSHRFPQPLLLGNTTKKSMQNRAKSVNDVRLAHEGLCRYPTLNNLVATPPNKNFSCNFVDRL